MAGDGPNGGPAGGTAILAISTFGLLPVESPLADHKAKFTTATVQACGLQPFTFFSVYLQVGLGVAGDNAKAMADIGTIADEQGKPFLATGDYNSGPAALRDSGFVARAGARTLHTTGPTCITSRSKSIIDFAIASEPLANICSDIRTDLSGHIATHRPVIFRFSRQLAVAQHTQLRLLKKMPPTRPFGPMRQGDQEAWKVPTSALQRVLELAKEGATSHVLSSAFASAYTAFADLAKDEIAKATDTHLLRRGERGLGPQIVQQPITHSWHKEYKTWGSRCRPLRWLLQRTHLARAASAADTEASETLEQLLTEINNEAPEAFAQDPLLGSLLSRVRDLCLAGAEDIAHDQWPEFHRCFRHMADNLADNITTELRRQETEHQLHDGGPLGLMRPSSPEVAVFTSGRSSRSSGGRKQQEGNLVLGPACRPTFCSRRPPASNSCGSPRRVTSTGPSCKSSILSTSTRPRSTPSRS